MRRLSPSESHTSAKETSLRFLKSHHRCAQSGQKSVQQNRLTAVAWCACLSKEGAKPHSKHRNRFGESPLKNSSQGKEDAQLNSSDMPKTRRSKRLHRDATMPDPPRRRGDNFFPPLVGHRHAPASQTKSEEEKRALRKPSFSRR